MKFVLIAAISLSLPALGAAGMFIDYDGGHLPPTATKQPMMECPEESLLWGTVIRCYFGFDERPAAPPPQVAAAKDQTAPPAKRIEAIEKLKQDALTGKERDCAMALFDRLRRMEQDDTPVRSALQEAIRSVTKSSYKMMDLGCLKWGVP